MNVSSKDRHNKNRNGKDLQEVEDIKSDGKNTQKHYVFCTEICTKKFLVTQITMMMWSLTQSQTLWV